MSEKLLFVTVTGPPLLNIAPPFEAVLLVNLVAEIVIVPELVLPIAPPETLDVLLEKTHLSTFSIAPLLRRAPPGDELVPFTKDISMICRVKF